MALAVVACGQPSSQQQVRNDPFDQSSEISDLRNRVDVLEKQAPYLNETRNVLQAERAETERAAARLEQLRAEQNQIQAGQRLLCDATHDC
jgi:prefoldin subunit 5